MNYNLQPFGDFFSLFLISFAFYFEVERKSDKTIKSFREKETICVINGSN